MLLQYAQLHLFAPPGMMILIAAYDALFHPHAQRLLARCDAVLRISGAF